MRIAGRFPDLPPTPKPTGGRVPDRRHRIHQSPRTGDIVFRSPPKSRVDGAYLYAHR